MLSETFLLDNRFSFMGGGGVGGEGGGRGLSKLNLRLGLRKLEMRLTSKLFSIQAGEVREARAGTAARVGRLRV